MTAPSPTTQAENTGAHAIPPVYCLYRSWTWQVNGKPSRAQACYPGDSCFMNNRFGSEDVGKTFEEPFRSASGKFEKFQVIKCKFPECI
jgi:hypothetical protein